MIASIPNDDRKDKQTKQYNAMNVHIKSSHDERGSVRIQKKQFNKNCSNVQTSVKKRIRI